MLIGLLSLPLLFRLIPRNRFYGVRTAKTLSEDRIWYATNRLGGWWFLVSSGTYVLFSILQPMSGSHDPRFSLWLAHLTVFLAPLVASVVMTIRYSRRL